MAIDIGPGATDRGTHETSRTEIDAANPANASGTITTVEIWAAVGWPLVNCEVATFYTTGGNIFSTRGTHTIGAVTAGSKQTFPGLSLSVEAGDYLGIYYTAGAVEKDNTGGAGVWQDYDNNDYIPCTDHEFTFGVNEAISIYGTGTTGVAAVAKKNVIFMGSNF